jgi:hypothetical protein
VFSTLSLRGDFLLVIVGFCMYNNDPTFCLLQAACIEVLDHCVVDISLGYFVYLSEVESKSVSRGHGFALFFRKHFVEMTLYV